MASKNNYTYISTPKGAKRVFYESVDDMAVVEGDIVIATAQQAELNRKRVEEARGVVAMAKGVSTRWPSTQLTYSVDSSHSEMMREFISWAAEHVSATSIIELIPVEDDADVRFVAAKSGCSSWIGRVASEGPQSIYIGPWCSQGAVVHEIMHTLGVYHEHTREDRDQFVRVHIENVLEGRAYNFHRQINQAEDIGAYDFSSIMHYPADAYSISDEPTLTRLDGSTEGFGQREGLSPGDIESLALLYGGAFIDAPDDMEIIERNADFTQVSFRDNSEDEQSFEVTVLNSDTIVSQFNLPGQDGLGTVNFKLEGLSLASHYVIQVKAIGEVATSAIATLEIIPNPIPEN